MIFFTNKFIPNKFAGCTYGPIILIRPEYEHDIGLIEHEKIHRLQWLITLGVHSILYATSKRYRLWAEVEAYREQLKYSPDNVLIFAGFICEKYNLDVTLPEAINLLKE